MSGIFKAYDVRGLYPEQLNEEMARSIGRVFRFVLDERDRGYGDHVVVSRDMRPHSEPLSEALIEGLREGGLDVVDIGLATTPMNYFAVGHLGAAGGVQVTASHNPAEYNGLKFSKSDARPVSGEGGIALMQAKIEAGEAQPAGRRGGYRRAGVYDKYGEHVLSFLEGEPSPLSVVVDAANGMGSIYRPLLERMGIRLDPLYFELDGTFPNHEANPLKEENLEDLIARVRAVGADLGISFDGDADRAAFVSEKGEAIGSDLMTALIGGEMLRTEPGSHVLYDLRSSRAVPEYITECGGRPVRERVGHSFMKATLREKKGIFGGELAGHYYFRANHHADCALLAVVEVLNLLRRKRQPLSRLVEPLRRYAKSPEINFVVEDKAAKLRELEERYAHGRIDHLDGVTVELADWWFNVRPSNTEPYLRLVLEAETDEALAEHRAELEELLGRPV
ncbi:MAG: phosphomannomutase/phosphoglucomutase [Thermoanaerobaculia bacterium]|nr:phosphomannomutase/phosphoglucomutase [Thermoanaerobaculia bacterium]